MWKSLRRRHQLAEAGPVRSTSQIWSAAPALLIGIALVVLTLELRYQGRLWWCACGRPFLVSGNVHSSHNSQHLFDPYSLTHVMHGMVLCGLFAWIAPRLAVLWRLSLTTCFEAGWEALENTELVVKRYRAATAAFGYEGDTVGNSLGDVLCCMIGFELARRIGWRASLVLIVLTEVILLFWIKDNLFLNVVMLIHPIDAVKQWQMRTN